MSDSPLWISHRGCQRPFLENTLEAFSLARDEGFDLIETDLQICGSGEIVLSHDAHLKRTFGDPRRLADVSLKEFLGLRGPRGEHPLAFQDFSERFSDMGWVLDIKPETGIQVLRELKRWAGTPSRREFLQTRCRFLLWNAEHQNSLGEWLPEVECFPGERACWRAGLAVMLGVGALGGIERGRCYSLPPRLKGISLYRSRWVGAYHRRGARVLAFLPSEGEDVERALAAGVDELLVDFPKPRRVSDVLSD